MSKDIIYRQDAIDAMCTWDKFGVDEKGRVVRWHEGLEPYVHLRDVVIAITGLPSAEPEIIRCGQCKYAEVADSEDSQDGYTCQFHRGSIWFSGSYCSWAELRGDSE